MTCTLQDHANPGGKGYTITVTHVPSAPGPMLAVEEKTQERLTASLSSAASEEEIASSTFLRLDEERDKSALRSFRKGILASRLACHFSPLSIIFLMTAAQHRRSGGGCW